VYRYRGTGYVTVNRCFQKQQWTDVSWVDDGKQADCLLQWLRLLLQYYDAVGWVFWLVKPTRVGEPTAAWQFVDIRLHWSFDNGWQYVSCGQRQPPLSGAPVNKWLSTIMRERWIPLDSESGGIPHLFGTSVPPYRQCLTGSSWQQQQQVGRLFQMAGTAELKARLPYAVRVHSTWSRRRVDERNVIDEPECWLEISWWVMKVFRLRSRLYQ